MKSFHNSPFFHLFLIALIGLLVYSNTFSVPFVFDDAEYILSNPLIKDLSSFAGTSMPAIGKNIELSWDTRRTGYLSLWLNYKIGGFAVGGYHVFNIAVHILNAALFYWLVLLTLKTPPVNSASQTNVALFSALLFAAHPVQTQAVTYVTQRFASLAAMFYLGSLVFYIKWRLAANPARLDLNFKGEAEGYYYVLSLLSAVLAMYSKENAFTLPLAIALYECVFFDGPLKRRLGRLMPFMMTMFIIPFTLLKTNDLDSATRAYTRMPRLDYLLTQFRVVVDYLGLLILPVKQNLDYDYPVYSSFWDAGVLLSFLFLLSILMSGFYIFGRMRPAGRMAAFGIFWFFLTLSIESSMIPTLDMIYEHRLYLPSVGAFMAFSSVSSVLLRKPRGVGTVLAVLVVFLLGLAAYERNKVWQSEIGLWSDSVKKSPGKARPHLNLGFAYLNEGMNESAANELKIAVGLEPDNVLAHYNLGMAYKRMARSIEAGLRTASGEMRDDRAAAYVARGLTDKAIEHYEAALRHRPDFVEAHINLGNVYLERGLNDKAVERYETALRLRPDSPKACNSLAIIYHRAGMLDRAAEYYKIAVRLDPDYAEAHFNFAALCSLRGMEDEAREHLEIAVRLRPEFAGSPGK